jgi:predicted nucleic acid-binding protein
VGEKSQLTFAGCFPPPDLLMERLHEPEELYVGADATGRKRLTQLEHGSEKVGRLLEPLLNGWTKTEDVLAQIAAKYGYEQIGRARMTNNTLIVTSAARQGITLLTVNACDFGRIAEFCLYQWSLC